jgi:predicted nucleotidyltransferase
MSFLSRVCQALSARGVRYAIVGGHAVALHGAVRGTVDIDIALVWNKKSLLISEQTLGDLGLVSRLPVSAEDVFRFRDEYINNRNLIGWNFYNPDNPTEQVDVVINYDLKNKKLKRIKTADSTVNILNIKDLIKMKKACGRPQDIEDVNALEKLV